MRWLAPLLCSLSIFVSTLSVRADAGDIIMRAAKWNRLYPQEKVYLHMDNTAYFLGETIWIKAYVTRSDTENRSNISKVLYVELISPYGIVVERRKLQVNDGLAWGDFKLNKKVMKSGYYEIRAYTRYMMNWGDESIFSRVVPIFDKPSRAGAYGELRIHNYNASVQNSDRQRSIHGQDTPEGDIRFHEDADSISLDADEGYGWALLHGSNIITGNTIAPQGRLHLSLSKEHMKEGQWQLITFDSIGKEIAHRSFFIMKEKHPDLRIINRTYQILPCGRVSLDIEGPPHTCFSLSVLDAASTVNGFQEDITEWMLRKSDTWNRYDWNTMTGQAPWSGNEIIEDRLYLFGNVIPQKKKMTRTGVSVTATLRGNEERMFGVTTTDSLGQYAITLPDIEGIWNMQLIPRLEGKQERYSITVDRHFSPHLRPFTPEEVKQIPLDTTRIHHMDTAPQFEDEWQKILDKEATTMKEVLVKGKRKADHYNYNFFTNTEDAESLSDIYFDCEEAAEEIADKGEEMPLLVEWLAQKDSRYREDSYGKREDFFYNRDPGEIQDGKDNSIKHFSKWADKPLIWYIDNQPLTGPWYPDHSLFLDDYQSVYISTKSSDYSSSTDQYVAFAYSYDHDPSKWVKKDKFTRYTHYQGYYPPSQFKTEDYSDIPPMPDYRRTLFWEPNLWTDENGKAHVEFWNNSSCTDMIFSAEGITRDGHFITGK